MASLCVNPPCEVGSQSGWWQVREVAYPKSRCGDAAAFGVVAQLDGGHDVQHPRLRALHWRPTDDFGPQSQSTFVYPRHEERTPMEWTKQGDLPVIDRVRTGALCRVITDGYRPWQ
jgi:hypothetical protein